MTTDLSGLDGPSAALVALVVGAAEELATHADLLNTLDGLAGDGDLGVTAGHAAAALAAIAPDAAAMQPGAALRRLGRAIAPRLSNGGASPAYCARKIAGPFTHPPSRNRLRRGPVVCSRKASTHRAFGERLLSGGAPVRLSAPNP